MRQYLGSDGLGCFTSGKYSLTHPEAGMLGYVQSDNEVTWAQKIAVRLRQDPDVYCMLAERLWEPYQATSQLAYTYRSLHLGPNVGEHLRIFHTLLRFY